MHYRWNPWWHSSSTFVLSDRQIAHYSFSSHLLPYSTLFQSKFTTAADDRDLLVSKTSTEFMPTPTAATFVLQQKWLIKHRPIMPMTKDRAKATKITMSWFLSYTISLGHCPFIRENPFWHRLQMLLGQSAQLEVEHLRQTLLLRYVWV